MKIKSMLQCLLAILACITMPSVHAQQCLAKIKEANTLKIGVGIMGLKPWIWQDEKGNHTGFEKEILDFIMQKFSIPRYEYVVTEWSTLIPGLNAKRWDIIMSALSKTQQRMQGGGIIFSDPYYLYNDRLIVLKNSEFQNTEDLKGKKVASTMGSMDSLVAHSLVKKGVIGEVLDFNNFGEPFQALRNGQVAAVVLDQATLIGQLSTNDDLRTVGEPLFYVPADGWEEAEAAADYRLGSVAIAMRPECSDLHAAINQALSEMEKQNLRQQILARYGLWDETQENLLK